MSEMKNIIERFQKIILNLFWLSYLERTFWILFSFKSRCWTWTKKFGWMSSRFENWLWDKNRWLNLLRMMFSGKASWKKAVYKWPFKYKTLKEAQPEQESICCKRKSPDLECQRKWLHQCVEDDSHSNQLLSNFAISEKLWVQVLKLIKSYLN